MQDSPWLTTAQAATYLCAGAPSTVRGWVRLGRLVPDGRMGTGGSWLFRRATLDAFARRCAHPTQPPDDAPATSSATGSRDA